MEKACSVLKKLLRPEFRYLPENWHHYKKDQCPFPFPFSFFIFLEGYKGNSNIIL